MALETIQEILDSGSESIKMSRLRLRLQSVFPELKESKDERIRKELIFYLGDMPEDTELRNGVTNRDVLVWLEKQGEQKLAEWTAEDEEELKIALNALEKAGQYSSANWLKNVCLVPQSKQEWSEEDERMFSFIQKKLTSEVDNWLESIKKRMEEQQ